MRHFSHYCDCGHKGTKANCSAAVRGWWILTASADDHDEIPARSNGNRTVLLLKRILQNVGNPSFVVQGNVGATGRPDSRVLQVSILVEFVGRQQVVDIHIEIIPNAVIRFGNLNNVATASKYFGESVSRFPALYHPAESASAQNEAATPADIPIE